MFTIIKDAKVTRRDLSLIPRPVPLGSRHQPVHHCDLIESIQKQIDEMYFHSYTKMNDIKLELVSENHGLLNTSVGSGTELYSNLNLKVYEDRGVKEIKALEGKATFSMGVINSNAQKKALTFFPGAVIGICTNGLMIKDVQGEMTKKKHLNSMTCVNQIRKGLQSFVDATFKIEETAKRMKEEFISSSDLSRALIEFGDSGTMGHSMVFKTYNEYKSEKHDKMHGRDTLWSLYNAGTQIIKGSSMLTQRRVMSGMQKDLVNVGLMPEIGDRPLLDHVSNN